MSSVAQTVQQIINQSELGGCALNHLDPLIASVDQGLVRMLRILARDFEVPDELAVKRSAAIALQQRLIHYADDLADGDIRDVENLQAVGPTVQYTMQMLANRALLDCEAQCYLRRFFLLLTQCGDAQHLEVSTCRWDLESSMQAAIGLNGKQYQAYFGLLGHGFAEDAANLGRHYGIAAHVATDVTSKDERFIHLGEEDRKRLLGWARESLSLILSSGLSITAPLQKISRALA